MSLKFSFNENGSPKPIIFVGENGSGKTNFLSIVADALLEYAAKGYYNIFSENGPNRTLFRMVGGATTSYGSAGSCAILEFFENGKKYFYVEKAGHLEIEEIMQQTDESMHPLINWQPGQSVKNISMDKGDAKAVFDAGSYSYFPSNRSEFPYWLNRESLKEINLDLTLKSPAIFRKPIYVERGIDEIKKWLVALLVDLRMDFTLTSYFVPVRNKKSYTVMPSGPVPHPSDLSHTTAAVWTCCNKILKIILGLDSVFFGWYGRNAHTQLSINYPDKSSLPLECLSTGQSTLLNIFLTILKYGDESQSDLSDPADIKGICVVDEIDAHIHIDLQYRALPQLMKIFPNVQFLVTNHSPLFTLGMDKEFGSDRISIFNLPDGMHIQAEAF